MEQLWVMKPDCVVTPLVDGWYAWPHLLDPATQAFHLAFRYIPLLESFIAAPEDHAVALSDPRMYGGPFVSLSAERAWEAEKFLARTRSARRRALGFAEEFRRLSRELIKVSGETLRSYRESLPEVLNGVIEINYDLCHRAQLNLINPMFEIDDLGLAEAQGVLLHDIGERARPFFLSEPLGLQTTGLNISGELASAPIKALAGSRWRPSDLEELSSAFGLNAAALRPFFDKAASKGTVEPFRGSGVRLRYFGHASVVVETAKTCIMLDPTFAPRTPAQSEVLTVDSLPPRIDYLIITHGHQDHLCPEALMQIVDKVDQVIVPITAIGELADPSLASIVRRLGFQNVREVAPLDKINVPDGVIMSLPFSGEHSELKIDGKHCIHIELCGTRLLFLVDSDAVNLGAYERLKRLIERPDIMFIGMECAGAPLGWLYGPLLQQPISHRADSSRRLSGADALHAGRVTELLSPKEVCVYAMGQEPWLRHLMGLSYTPDSYQLLQSSQYVSRCKSLGIPARRLSDTFEVTLQSDGSKNVI